VEELPSDVGAEGLLRRERREPVGVEPLAPDAKDVGESQARGDADDPVWASGGHRVVAALVRDADPRRDDHDLPVDEHL
jgi:hypothetical protein